MFVLDQVAVVAAKSASLEPFKTALSGDAAAVAELVYQSMMEMMQFVRSNGYKTIFVNGGSQDFVRVYCERVYGVPRDQVVGNGGRPAADHGLRQLGWRSADA